MHPCIYYWLAAISVGLFTIYLQQWIVMYPFACICSFILTSWLEYGEVSQTTQVRWPISQQQGTRLCYRHAGTLTIFLMVKHGLRQLKLDRMPNANLIITTITIMLVILKTSRELQNRRIQSSVEKQHCGANLLTAPTCYLNFGK